MAGGDSYRVGMVVSMANHGDPTAAAMRWGRRYSPAVVACPAPRTS